MQRRRRQSRALLIARNLSLLALRRLVLSAPSPPPSGLPFFVVLCGVPFSCPCCRPFQAVIAPGFHLFPFRTEKLSPSAPMVLHTRGRVGRRRLYCLRGSPGHKAVGPPFFVLRFASLRFASARTGEFVLLYCRQGLVNDGRWVYG